MPMPEQSTTAKKTAIFRRMPRLYEYNYVLLVQLLPECTETEKAATHTLSTLHGVQLNMVSTGPHTTFMTLSHGLANGGRLIPNIRLETRIYHDARMVEVVAYQGRGRFRPYYATPNRHMYQAHEKQQVNLFFHEWLRHCLRQSVRFE